MRAAATKVTAESAGRGGVIAAAVPASEAADATVTSTDVVQQTDEQDGELAVDDGRKALVVDREVAEACLFAVLEMTESSVTVAVMSSLPSSVGVSVTESSPISLTVTALTVMLTGPSSSPDRTP